MSDGIQCECGCGSEITPLGLNGRPRRFLKGHQTKGRRVKRDDLYWESRLTRLQKRAEICACGCGEMVSLTLDWLKGYGGSCVWIPKYKMGHIPLIPCGCGCAKRIPAFNRRNQPRTHLPEHAGRARKLFPQVDWAARLQVWSQTAPKCACGCGEYLSRTVQQLQNYKPETQFLLGHHRRRGCLTEITAEERSVILGSLLGDFSISRPKETPRLAFTHGINQKEYALYKMEKLERFAWFWEETVTSGYKEGGMGVRGSSSCMPVLEQIWQIVRPEGQKRITLQWLSLIDDLALAFWFMDDGSISKSNGHISYAALHTEGYSEEENNLSATWFHHLGMQNTRVAHAKNRPYLYFPRQEAEELIRRVRPYLHSSMLYKAET